MHQTQQAAFAAAIVETFQMLDNQFPRGWFRIDDTQLTTWNNINNTQAPGWSTIDNSQLSGWTDIDDSQG